jgi:hypothetical protein
VALKVQHFNAVTLHSIAEKEDDVFISNNVVSALFFYSNYILVPLNLTSMMVAVVFAKYRVIRKSLRGFPTSAVQ